MLKFRPLPTLDRLNELLEVVEIPEDKFGKWSGLVWKINRGRTAKAGSVAGTLQPDPRLVNRRDWRVKIDRVSYLVSRIIYYMVQEQNPGYLEIDHEDQNWLNNNSCNLRLDNTGRIQQVNRPAQRNNVSGVVNVNWHRIRKKWQAQVDGEYLGLFACKVEAAHVVNEKWRELGWLELGRKLNDLETIACDCGKCYPAGKTT